MSSDILYLHGGPDATISHERIKHLLDSDEFFWLSLDGVDDADLLLNTFGFHPLAVEDAVRLGQRPKIDQYDGFTYWVAHGLNAQADIAEVHIFFSTKYLVTVGADCEALFAEVHRRMDTHPPKSLSPESVTAVYLILDALVDSFFPRLADLDERIDELEDDILKAPTEDQLGELFALKRRLVSYRKTITPQRDLMARVLGRVDAIEGMTDEDLRYFRDLYDHLIRISDMVDSYRDLVSGAVDTHISMVSNRMNVIMKQLTIIATVFLPLTFLTGFFGQNFSFLVNHVISPTWTFWVYGVGCNFAAIVGLVWYGRRSGWFGGPSA